MKGKEDEEEAKERKRKEGMDQRLIAEDKTHGFEGLCTCREYSEWEGYVETPLS